MSETIDARNGAGRSMPNGRPPRDNLVRAIAAPLEFRADSDENMPTLVSRFATFDEWTEIDSWFEGRFLERIARGAFKKTMRENRDQIKVLYDHGHDPQVGNKILGPIDALYEDETHAVGEAPLFDTGYVNELLPGLRAGVYGSSFRFRVMAEEIVQKPKRSDHNPDGLPERTIKEIRLFEFGPVTFPAYASSTAGVRSLTDEFLVGRDPERVRALIERYTAAPEPSEATTPADTEPERSDATTLAEPDERPFAPFAAWERRRRIAGLRART